MKKIIAITLILILCLSLCACGEPAPTVESVLATDIWADRGWNSYKQCFASHYEFYENGNVYYYYYNELDDKGTYTITDSEIILFMDGDETRFNYTFEDGVLNIDGLHQENIEENIYYDELGEQMVERLF